jgi:hypothetical protein
MELVGEEDEMGGAVALIGEVIEISSCVGFIPF